MTKKELIFAVAERTGNSVRSTDSMFKALIATIEDCLVSGDKVQIVGFGSLEVKERAARTGRDMMTGKTVTIDPRRTVVFRPGNQLKQLVNTNNQL